MKLLYHTDAVDSRAHSSVIFIVVVAIGIFCV